MKKVALVIFVVGVLLLTLLFKLPSREIVTMEDLEEIEVNGKVILRGEVAEERVISNGRRILDVNGIDIVVDSSGEDFEGKEVEIEGIVTEYEGKKQVEALKIRS